MAYTIPAYLQPGVVATPGSDLYNQRIAYNTSRGVPGGGAGVGVPGLETGVASSVNQFMTGQAQLPFIQNLPGYLGMRAQNSMNILSQLQGDVPTDVINEILQQAAERGIATGGGAGVAKPAYLKALGLTSLDLMKQGQEGLSKAISDTPVPELWNPADLYTSERLANKQLEIAKAGATTSTSGSRTTSPWGNRSFTNENFFGGIW